LARSPVKQYKCQRAQAQEHNGVFRQHTDPDAKARTPPSATFTRDERAF
jgi:hypothetical protein